jgi:hypothetical protein
MVGLMVGIFSAMVEFIVCLIAKAGSHYQASSEMVARQQEQMRTTAMAHMPAMQPTWGNWLRDVGAPCHVYELRYEAVNTSQSKSILLDALDCSMPRISGRYIANSLSTSFRISGMLLRQSRQ